MIILNIGLKIDALSDEFNTPEICTARAYLAQGYFARLGFSVGIRLADSDTELTAIISIHNSADWHTVLQHAKDLSDMLGQDCIAVYNTAPEKGTLVGINADKWGGFNKDYFLMP